MNCIVFEEVLHFLVQFYLNPLSVFCPDIYESIIFFHCIDSFVFIRSEKGILSIFTIEQLHVALS